MKIGIGQDSHRFVKGESTKPCIIAGVEFDDVPGMKANSDGDVVLHAICNAISSLTHVLILGGIADELCLRDGITDSSVYLREGMKTLGDEKVAHVAVTIEGLRPKMKGRLVEMRESVAAIMGLDVSQVGITATSGEGLTDFGCGEGLQAFCVLSVGN